MEPTLEIFNSQINILGSFNPPVISPAWLKSNDLIGSDDADCAMEGDSLAITPDICRFETEWFSLQVIKQQFVLFSKGPVTPAFKDLAVGIFTLLEHTPVTAMGLNSIADYKIYSVDEYHKIGDTLAPKKIWNSFYPDSDNQSVGLQEMTLQINPVKRGEKVSGRQKRVSFSSSEKLPNALLFTFNDHFPVTADKKSKQSASDVTVEIIQTHWQTSMDEAKNLFSSVIKQAINA